MTHSYNLYCRGQDEIRFGRFDITPRASFRQPERLVLLDPLVARLTVDGIRHQILITAGTVSDGLTIPWWIRPVAGLMGITPMGAYVPAALIHDVATEDVEGAAARLLPDKLFRRALWVMRTPWFHRFILYRCVRTGSQYPAIYRKDLA